MVVLVKRTRDAQVPSQDKEEVLGLERCIFQGQLLVGKERRTSSLPWVMRWMWGENWVCC